MPDIPDEWVEKAALAIGSVLGGDTGKVYDAARAVLAAVWDDLHNTAGARIDAAGNTPSAYDPAMIEDDDLPAAGLPARDRDLLQTVVERLCDAAQVRADERRKVAEEIERDAERQRPQTFWQKLRAGAAGPGDPKRWFWEGQMHAATIAREAARADTEEADRHG